MDWTGAFVRRPLDHYDVHGSYAEEGAKSFATGSRRSIFG